MNENGKVNILGTEYTIKFHDRDEDQELKNAHGYCDVTSKTIVVEKKSPDDTVNDFPFLQRKTLRHEITHAFIFESGLFSNTYNVDCGWAMNEEMVDWIAIQFPKMMRTFQECGVL